MAAISAKMVKDLREMTGAGMMDCKKALSATDGDMDKAVEFLREKGLAAAAKKAGRIAAEGIVYAVVKDDTKATIVEVNSETDFVAKNADFQAYVAEVAEQTINSANENDMDAFLAETWNKDASKTVADELSSKTAIIGEKLSIRRFQNIQAADGCVVSYIHGGGRIGVLLEAATAVVNDTVKEALKNVAMQIAALKPMYLDRASVSEEFIEHEKEILLAQIKNDPKEAQVYVKAEDGKQSVAQYLADVSKAEGTTITLKSFVRFETGEGMEKKEENFAEEVAKQMGM